MKCLPLRWFPRSSWWVSSLEIKLIHDIVQRYCRYCWPEGALSFLRPFHNCILEYKWVYTLKKIFHLNSSQHTFFFKLHHPLFTKSIHTLNPVLWLCKIILVWGSATQFWPCFISCTLRKWRPGRARWTPRVLRDVQVKVVLCGDTEIANSEFLVCPAVSQIKVKQATNCKWILFQTTQSPSDRVMLSGGSMHY